MKLRRSRHAAKIRLHLFDRFPVIGKDLIFAEPERAGLARQNFGIDIRQADDLDAAALIFFSGDSFLSRHVARLAFYLAVCAMHGEISKDLASIVPQMRPSLPDAIVRAESVLEHVIQLASTLSVTLQFNDVSMVVVS